MNPTIDEFLYMFEDLGSSRKARSFFKERSKSDLRIKNVNISFSSSDEKVIGSMKVDYLDPNGELKKEDLEILLILNGENWTVSTIEPTKL